MTNGTAGGRNVCAEANIPNRARTAKMFVKRRQRRIEQSPLPRYVAQARQVFRKSQGELGTGPGSHDRGVTDRMCSFSTPPLRMKPHRYDRTLRRRKKVYVI